ncbi:serpin family protein [Chloroflexota bacterium]
MRKALLVLLAFILLVAPIQVGCGNNNTGPIASEISFDPNERFDIKLFQAVSSFDTGNNVFMSPLSVEVVLAMMLNGAEGDTLYEMIETLELSDFTKQQINERYHDLIETLKEVDPNVVIDIAQSIWYRQGFTWRQEFLDLCSMYYGAQIEPISTAEAVNIWVEEQTAGLIDHILDAVDPADMMYLLNTIYFRGDWIFQFEAEDTEQEPFYLIGGSQTQCQMMYYREHYDYYEDDSVQVISMPYRRGYYEMVVVLPAEGENIDEFIDEFTQSKWETWISGMQGDYVKLYMPKFKFEYEVELNEVLEVLGMEVAFTPDADFSGMIEDEDIWIEEVKHKTTIDVNEQGTVVAAATQGTMTMGISQSPPTMRVDRPFLFAIRERTTDTILFMGKVVEPSYE